MVEKRKTDVDRQLWFKKMKKTFTFSEIYKDIFFQKQK